MLKSVPVPKALTAHQQVGLRLACGKLPKYKSDLDQVNQIDFCKKLETLPEGVPPDDYLHESTLNLGVTIGPRH